MISKSFVFLFCALPVLGWGDDRTSISGPVSAFLFDSQSRSIRPMIGFPGASYLGDAAVANVDAAAVSADGSAALAVRQGQLYLITGLRTGAPTEAAVDGAISGADRFAWAQDASAAAVYSSASGRAQVLRNLFTNPLASAAIDFSGAQGSLSALAVDRSGTHVLAGFSAADAGGVYAAAAGASARFLAGAASPVAIVLANQDRDLYFADRSRQQIWQIQNFDDQPAPLLFADSGSGVSSPVGIQLSADSKRLYVAEAGSQSLDIFDVNARASSGRINLEFTPDTLHTLRGQSLLLLKNSTGAEDPFYVVNDAGTADGLAVFFVPAGRQQ